MKKGSSAWSAIRGVALVGLIAITVAGCEDVTGTLDGGVRGTYTLTRANGNPLPAVIYEGPYVYGDVVFDAVVTAESGELTLRDDTYRESIEMGLVLDGQDFGSEDVVVSGDYTVQNSILSFDPLAEDSPSFTGTLQGSTLTTVETSPEFGTQTYTWVR